MAASSQTPGPYDSAGDPPSIVELRQQILALKALTRAFARKQRNEVLRLEAELERMITVIDGFYALLVPRHWIFHDP